MITILKSGTIKVIDCPICGCKFSYEKDDVINEDTDLYKGWKEYVTCPQCKAQVILRQTR